VPHTEHAADDGGQHRRERRLPHGMHPPARCADRCVCVTSSVSGARWYVSRLPIRVPSIVATRRGSSRRPAAQNTPWETTMTDPTAFGARLRAHRERAGKTRPVLGGLVGRSAEWVKALENGRLLPPRPRSASSASCDCERVDRRAKRPLPRRRRRVRPQPRSRLRQQFRRPAEPVTPPRCPHACWTRTHCRPASPWRSRPPCRRMPQVNADASVDPAPTA
jgi:hypothetical protein